MPPYKFHMSSYKDLSLHKNILHNSHVNIYSSPKIITIQHFKSLNSANVVRIATMFIFFMTTLKSDKTGWSSLFHKHQSISVMVLMSIFESRSRQTDRHV
jgi:hypothetical protein